MSKIHHTAPAIAPQSGRPQHHRSDIGHVAESLAADERQAKAARDPWRTEKYRRTLTEIGLPDHARTAGSRT